MKKNIALLLAVLMLLFTSACSNSSNSDLEKLKNDNKFILTGLNYDMSFKDVAEVLKVSSEKSEFDSESTNEYDGKEYKYSIYLRRDFNFLGKSSTLNITCIDDVLYGVDISIDSTEIKNKSIDDYYKELTDELVKLYGNGEQKEFNDDNTGESYQALWWKSDNTALTVGLSKFDSGSSSIVITLADLSKALGKTFTE